MVKKFVKRFQLDPHLIKSNRYLKVFGDLLHEPNLWHLHRRSVAKAFFIGLFICYIPVPGHMLLAALCCIIFKANLPLSIALVWVANPFTMPPMYYFGYFLGNKILRTPHQRFHFELSIQWIKEEFYSIYLPMLVGSTVCGIVLGLIGYFIVRLAWRYHVVTAWRKRPRSAK